MNALETTIKSVNTVLKSWAPLFIDREDKYTNEQRAAVLAILSTGTTGAIHTWNFPFTTRLSSPYYRVFEETVCPFDGSVEYRSRTVYCDAFEHKWQYAQALMQEAMKGRIYSLKEDTCMDKLVRFVTRISKLDESQAKERMIRMSSRYGTLRRTRLCFRDIGLEEATADSWTYECEPLDIDGNIGNSSYLRYLRVHTDSDCAGYCLLLPNQEERITLRFDYLKLGRAIKRCLPNANDELVKELTNSTLPGELTIDTDYDAWFDAYVRCPEWGSCMHGVEYGDVCAFEVYVDSPDAAIARLYSVDGKVIARAVVNYEKREFETVYGNSRLNSRLVKLGYTQTDAFTDGMHIKCIKTDDGDTLIAPYMDGDGTWCDAHNYEHGEWMQLGSFQPRYIQLESTDGYIDLTDY